MLLPRRSARGGSFFLSLFFCCCRPGCAFSLVTLEELPYALDLLTFVGGGRLVGLEDWRRAEKQTEAADKQEPTSSPVSTSSKERRFVFPLGGLPPLHFFVEAVERHLKQDSEVGTLTRSAEAAQKLYLKTRPSASKDGCARAKRFVEENGGAAALAASAFSEEELMAAVWTRENAAAGKKGDLEEMPQNHRELLERLRTEGGGARPSVELIQTLRQFRPKIGAQGSVLAAGVVKAIEERRQRAAAVGETLHRQSESHLRGATATEERASGEEAASSDDDAEQVEPVASQEKPRSETGVLRSLLADGSGGAPGAGRGRSVKTSKRRLLKAAKELGIVGASKGAAAAAERVLSAAELSAASVLTQKNKPDVFLDVSAEAKAAGQHVVLQMQRHSLNFVGDEEEALKRKRTEERRK